jgi:hypothetical protein
MSDYYNVYDEVHREAMQDYDPIYDREEPPTPDEYEDCGVVISDAPLPVNPEDFTISTAPSDDEDVPF